MLHDFTLIIPTYNRPRELAAQLNYLDALGARFPIFVLDSSRPEVSALNKQRVEATRLRVRYYSYPEEITGQEKFADGVERVETPYCGLCADDDLVIIRGLLQSLDALRSNQRAVVAQGYTFMFQMDAQGAIVLSHFVNFNPSVTSQLPLARIAETFDRYQAVVYGCFRTPTLRRILKRAESVFGPLFHEFLMAALTAIEGQIIRVPVVSHGRYMGPSFTQERWHPLEWFCRDPVDLFSAYHQYRNILVDAVTAHPDNKHSAVATTRILDLIHVHYMIKHAPVDALDFIIDRRLAGDAFEAYWPGHEVQVPLYMASEVEARSSKKMGASESASSQRRLLFFRRKNESIPTFVDRRVRSYHIKPGIASPPSIAMNTGEIRRVIDALEHYDLGPESGLQVHRDRAS